MESNVKTIYQNFMAWLENEISGWKALKLIMLLIILGSLENNVIAPLFAHMINHTISEQVTTISVLQKNAQSVPIVSLKVLGVLVNSGLTEEVIFRLIPLGAAVLLFSSRWKPLIIVVALASSAYFGYTHGGYDLILFQGFHGLLFCLVFLKCGGMMGNLLKGMWYSFCMHFLSNALALTIALALGGRYITFPFPV